MQQPGGEKKVGETYLHTFQEICKAEAGISEEIDKEMKKGVRKQSKAKGLRVLFWHSTNSQSETQMTNLYSPNVSSFIGRASESIGPSSLSFTEDETDRWILSSVTS